MKAFVIFCLIASIHAYVDVLDKQDIDAFLNNAEEFEAHIHCFLDEGPCTEEMEHIKSHISEGVSDLCAKCSPTQKSQVLKSIEVLMSKYPVELMKLTQKYDPELMVIKRFAELMG